MKVEVCITNLGNGKYIYGNISSLINVANLKKTVNQWGMNDTEVQLIGSDVNISDRNLIPLLELLEEHKINANDLAALFQVGTAKEVEEILEQEYSYQFIEACSKESAFQEYYEHLYNGLPEHLECYID